MKIKNKTLKAVIIISSVIAVWVLLFGFYPPISRTVVDAETGKPIEGAVILAEWTIKKGLGYTGTYSYKVVEAITDKDGKARISGLVTINPFVNRPNVTVYKKGYVAWNNEYVFPDYRKREDFRWSIGYVFRLERFKPEYSYDEHESFIYNNAISGPLEKKELFLKAYREWEEKKVLGERRKNGH